MFSDLKEIYIPLEILQPAQHSDTNSVLLTQEITESQNVRGWKGPL